jgi:hypothetical protein
MNQKTKKIWEQPIVGVYELSADVVTTSPTGVLVTDEKDDGKPFKDTWYNN